MCTLILDKTMHPTSGVSPASMLAISAPLPLMLRSFTCQYAISAPPPPNVEPFNFNTRGLIVLLYKTLTTEEVNIIPQ